MSAGHGRRTVGRVTSAELPTDAFGPWPDHHDATRARTVEYVSRISGDDQARVVDGHRNPPLTLGVRLVSVVSDDPRHAGQAAFVRGLLPR
jgi:hypothetical protein